MFFHHHHKSRPPLAFGAVLAGWALLGTGCGDPDTFVPYDEFGGPAGALSGTVSYIGPPPCTRGGEIIGVAVLYAFDENLLPPPDGLGTAPAGMTVVPGELLFRGLRSQLVFHADGSRWCPAPGAESIASSGAWAISPLPAGTFQVRGFYDYDGNYHPAFSIFNLPTRGDIGGGAVENAAAALSGQEPVRYRSVPLGTQQSNGRRVIPETGAHVAGITVSLGLPMPFERPLFFAAQVRDQAYENSDPTNVVIPADYELGTFNLDPTRIAETEASFVRLVLHPGVPAAEHDAARGNPFHFPVDEPHFWLSQQDSNGDGLLSDDDHIPETPAVPSLAPQALFTRLVDGSELVSASAPVVLLQGLVLNGSLGQTATTPAPDPPAPMDELLVAVRPAVACLTPSRPGEPGVLLLAHDQDREGNPLVPDEAALKAGLEARFGRPMDIAFGCLPQGRYAVNLVYDTGQAWTVPNEAGVCAPSEAASGSQCGSRPRLASQRIVLTMGTPRDGGYCQQHPTPSACLP